MCRAAIIWRYGSIAKPSEGCDIRQEQKKLQLDNIFKEHSSTKTQTSEDDLPAEERPRSSAPKKRSQPKRISQHHHRISVSHGSGSRLASPLDETRVQDSSDSSEPYSSNHDESASSSILDILDSDEEACAQQLQPFEFKRRKITPLVKRSDAVSHGRIQKRDRETMKVMRDKRKGRATPPIQNATTQITQTENPTRHGAVPSQQDLTDTSASQDSVGESLPSRKMQLSRKPTQSMLDRKNNLRDTLSENDDVLQAVQLLEPQTPKAKRNMIRSSESSKLVPSPSQLLLTSLRLTPDKKIQAAEESVTPRRARNRLTDQLDAPEGSIKLGSTSTRSNSAGRLNLRDGFPFREETTDETSSLSKSASEEASISQRSSKPAAHRSRVTYARERSHLRDMMDEIEDLEAPSKSHFSAALPSAPLEFFNTDATGGPDVEGEHEISGATTVKSIHELRQAGVNNRFERDLESTFEDIETGNVSSKALRIQALLQLIQKLGDSVFARQFVDVGMTKRLAHCVQGNGDIISAVLLTHALSLIFPLDQVNSEHLSAAFRTIVNMSPDMLTHTQPFVKLVTDRKQNLSKALSRDLVEFNKAAITRFYPRLIEPWTPQSTALFALERLLQTLRTLKIVSADFPTALFNQLLTLLSTTHEVKELFDDHQQITTTILSILEYSAVLQVSPADGEDASPGLNFNLLGNVVARLLDNPMAEDFSQGNIALRLVVSLTNNEPIICAALVETDLINSVYLVIEQNFLNLSDSADRGDEFDNSKLDSVIMALGCLLNLADCSRDARFRIFKPPSQDSSSIQWLVSVFNKRVGKSTEATTLPQSHVVVAFGYLSMLLCTLCLEDEIYRFVTESIHGKDITALCLEAQEFLDKLETIASLNPDDPASSTFNSRFRSILVSLSARISL